MHLQRVRLGLGILGPVVALGLAALAWWAYSSIPYVADHYLQAGAGMLKPGTYPRAIRALTRSIAFRDNPRAYLLRGEAYQALGNCQHAIQDFTRAIQLAPNEARGYTDRGSCYRATGDFDKALADLTKSIAISPGSANYLERGLTYTSLQRWTAAEEDLDRAIEMRPGVPDFHRARSYVRIQLGDLEGAAADRKEATKFDRRP